MRDRVLFLIFVVVLFSGPIVVGSTHSVWVATLWYVALLSISLTLMKLEHLSPLFTYRRGLILRSVLYLLLLYGLLALTSLLFPQQYEIVQTLSSLDPMMVVLLVVLAPLAEEVAFRGYTQSVFKRKLGTDGAIIVTSLLFSLFHPISMFPQVFVTSLLLGTIKEVHGSLIPCVVVHCLNNVVAFVASL
ncbi:hypothetical protein AS159_00375 [Thermotoga sp. Ku-13t]|uniref:CPBP family intramembrane glutamic endopeptidase n=1 Tax=Thermotoga sp. Ku-13t TaxID=1755813 RepID=UPI0013EBD498|nr:CPBP family intramembrane glutamic endopeptidase [Thermotoga sp. Ku-13t]KAF2958213.1 hypothetical protein AS159_00375 [Thermotoga sp. Ku-13t]